MSKDPPVDNAIEELGKLTFGSHFDFTAKSPLTDVTFIIEGRKIYAGGDFLSIHSPFFKALLKGGYAETGKEELELKDVIYEDFLEMLKYLVDSSRKIKVEVVQSLLILGDRFDIKYLIDRAESFLMNTSELSVSEKLLLADRYRLVKLQTTCVDRISCENEQTLQEVVSSKEFGNLAEAAKKAFNAVSESTMFHDGHYNPNYETLPINCGTLVEVENVQESSNDFLATGLLTVKIPLGYSEESEEEPEKEIVVDIAGLFWSSAITVERDQFGKAYTSYLIVNNNRPTSVEWSVKGFVVAKLANVAEDAGEAWRDIKKYDFTLNNSQRALQICQSVDCFFLHLHCVTYNIFITSISGLRQNQSFDFASPSDLSNAVFIVEGRKIHVNKQYLSTISPRFNEMFYEKNEVELKNMEYKDFIEFLYWIYPSSKRNTTVSSMFPVLSIDVKLGVNILKSVVHNCISNLDIQIFFPERIIFHLQFDIDDEKLLLVWRTVSPLSDELHKATYYRVRESELFAKMTAEKKVAMYEWMSELEEEVEWE